KPADDDGADVHELLHKPAGTPLAFGRRRARANDGDARVAHEQARVALRPEDLGSELLLHRVERAEELDCSAAAHDASLADARMRCLRRSTPRRYAVDRPSVPIASRNRRSAWASSRRRRVPES